MGLIKQIVQESHSTPNQLDESVGGMIGRYIENRNMGRVRYKFLVRGTSRIAFIQTDRREFFSIEVAGRRMTGEPTEYMSLPEADEAARQYENDGYRLVNDADDAETVIGAVIAGLRRRSGTFSGNEIPVVAAIVNAHQILNREVDPTEVDPTEVGPTEKDQGHLAFIGRGWFRLIE